MGSALDIGHIILYNITKIRGDKLMARPLRIEYKGAFYHVTSRGNERKKIYYAESDYEKFISILKESQNKYGYLLHVYVLMDNHYHLLIETPQANLSKIMHYINGFYTGYINVKRKRSGHLFQGRYKSILIDKDNYLLELSRYIHLNPVRKKMVEKPEDYIYSSYTAYISQEQYEIVYQDLILGMISKEKKEAKRRYKDFVDKAIISESKNPLKNVYGGTILGDKKFVKESLSQLKDKDLQKKDISYRRVMQGVYEPGEIIDSVSKYFKIPQYEILGNKKREYRNIAIYLIKKYSALTNYQISQLFTDINYSTVAKAYQRFKKKVEEDQLLKKKVEEIIIEMSNVEG